MRRIILLFLLLLPLQSFAQFSFDLPGQIIIDFGLINLVETPPKMELKTWGSRSVNIYYLYDGKLGGEKFSFHPGFGLGIDKYNFQEDILLSKKGSTPELSIDDLSMLYGNTIDVKKTLLATEYIDIPLELRFKTNNGRKAFRIGIGGKVGLLLASKSKVIMKDAAGQMLTLKEKNNFSIEQFRYGMTGRIGLGAINLFAYYNFNQLFEKGALDISLENKKIQSFVIGITLTAL